MKFAAVALILGCSAIGYEFVAQSTPLENTVASKHPSIRLALARLHSFIPHVSLTPTPAPLQAVEKTPQAIPLLPKSETLALIATAAAKHNVPAAFVQSIVAAESNFNCAAVSPKGAIGLMQLMPETAQQFGADPSIPAQNIDAGTHYLRVLMDRYQKKRNQMKHVIAAYNAGPGMVDKYHGVPPFRETRCYVTRVLAFFRQFGGSLKRQGFRG
jgi:soluble lytic murein transglycosylase-like protein